MQLLAFIAQHILILIALSLISYLLGYRLFTLLKVNFHDSFPEAIAFSSALGLCIISYLVFFIGIAGLLKRLPIIIILACLLIWAVPAIKPTIQLIKQQRFSKTYIIPLILFAVCPIILIALYPPTAFDSTLYHLALAKTYLAAGKISLAPFLRYEVFPQFGEMLFTAMMLFFDDISAQLVSLLMLILIDITIFAFCDRYYSHSAGILSALIFLSNPIVLWLSSIAYIDITMTFFVTISAFSLINWIKGDEFPWLIITALMTGVMADIKYTGLFFVGVFGLIAMYFLIRKRYFKQLLVFGLVLGFTIAPWYIYNFYYTGNPVWPFFSNLFGFKLWDKLDLANQIASIQLAASNLRDLRFIMSLPFNLVFHPEILYCDFGFSIALLPLLPIALIPAIKDPILKASFGLLMIFTLFCLYSAPVLRYLAPILPVASVIAGIGLDWLIRYLVKNRPIWNKALVTTISLILVISVWTFAFQAYKLNGRPPVSQKQREMYLAQKLPTYVAYQYLNNKFKGNYVVYSLMDENMNYFADGKFIGDWFGPGRFGDLLNILKQKSSEEALYKELKGLGANYFLVNRDRYQSGLPDGWRQWMTIHPVFSTKDVIVFHIDG